MSVQSLGDNQDSVWEAGGIIFYLLIGEGKGRKKIKSFTESEALYQTPKMKTLVGLLKDWTSEKGSGLRRFISIKEVLWSLFTERFFQA